ncbi:MAG: hypothetical protein ISS76_21090 [Phycisphaerae bacterium]|nr:hypothetical protein [Phycisphaerae bacterium]
MINLNCLSKILLGFGYIIWTISGFWGFCIELGIAHKLAGFWGVIIAIVLFPLTLIVTPIYSIIADGNWLPFILIYGGTIVGVTFCSFSLSIMKNIQKQESKREYLREGEENE